MNVNAQNAAPRLLLVDDEADILRALTRLLRRLRPVWQCDATSDPRRACELLSEHAYHVVLTDLRMPDIDGLSLLQEVVRLQPMAVRLLLTGTADFATAQRAVNESGVYRYLTKPWQDPILVAHLDSACQHALKLREQDEQASAWQASIGLLTPEDIERRRLEALEPGIMHVDWTEDGAIQMPALNSPQDSSLGER
jgi:two-component system, probable response regulator PhcQ